MAKKEKKEPKIEHVVCDAIATDDGFYKGRIIKTNQKFRFEGVTKDGKFPNWVKPVGAVKKVQGPAPKAKVKDVILADSQGEQEEDLQSSLV